MNEKEFKLPLAQNESQPLIEKADAIPLLQIDLLDALEKFHPDFVAHFVTNILLKQRSDAHIQRLLVTVGLYYKVTHDAHALSMLFYAGYLTGQIEERARLGELFGEESVK